MEVIIPKAYKDCTAVELVQAYPYNFVAAYGWEQDEYAHRNCLEIEQILYCRLQKKEVDWILDWAVNEYCEGRKAIWTDEVTEKMWAVLYDCPKIEAEFVVEKIDDPLQELHNCPQETFIVAVYDGILTHQDLLDWEWEQTISSGGPDEFDEFEGKSDDLGRLEFAIHDNRHYIISYIEE